MAGKWRKSSRSNPNGGDCVEVRLAGPVEVRDSKAPQLGTLAMSRTEFTSLLEQLSGR
ncbi:DUF397 domain-containing protein [Stackebrandtia nassauensis]|uniref:DUF397 domain-containing protein n=1 Tax=Stackebrandtia nassauensis (strain DSM 44728 / CIP 108903 / NRRL B-16338 / NBRC 102104 / LLR-40K-21) TaxID=446470 RepID=D3Q0Z0_STANL|nr:DUF397 domain-containing protein [Stackebrandtia nassauensis]ADD43740.1 protein of unknown function DUF397 [Stackebrandtia nassauensis DSM 44728]